MSYLKSYETLRAVNLHSTKTLAEMSARCRGPGRTAFHSISTISVANMATTAILSGKDVYSEGPLIRSTEDFVFRPSSVAAYLSPSVASTSDIIKAGHGYIATKWASEVLNACLSGSHIGLL